MLVVRAPHVLLRPFVRTIWTMEPGGGDSPAPGREHVLPTGLVHLAMRLSGPPLRVFTQEQDAHGMRLPPALLGGARDSHYVRETGGAVVSVGALLEPGAAAALFSVPTGELAQRHTALQDVWGPLAGEALDRLDAAGSAHRRLAVLEALLWRKLANARPLHPAVTLALRVLKAGAPVGQAVQASGLSHRRLIDLFRAGVGLAPKQYARVLRLQQWMAQVRREPSGWADAALAAGFADQPHLNREFRGFAGITPGQWLRSQPVHPNHVPWPR
ncbi:MAG: helix-turn-helix domain-containing protein [Pseudomonadota bacterium]